mgnify:CR=1 FL=1
MASEMAPEPAHSSTTTGSGRPSRSRSSAQPVITSVWAQWRAATDIEQNDVVVRDDRAKCYMLRASLYQLFHSVALLCGGPDWAAEVGPEIYRTYREHPENFDA